MSGYLDYQVILDFLRYDLKLEPSIRIKIFQKLAAVDSVVGEECKEVIDSKNKGKAFAEQQRQQMVRAQRGG